MRFLAGIDDTDSSRGYCTTYLAYRIATDLSPVVRVCAYPRLVRLNPNIPFKTRGNAAVCLTLEGDDPDEAFRALSSKVRALADVEGGANSGMVFLDCASKADAFQDLYQDALSAVVSPQRARSLVRQAGGRTLELGNGMGVVGAAASLGFAGTSDHTYELIAYRRKECWGTRRLVDSSSVKEMDARMFPHTFNSFDYQKRKVLVAPHGPDPVFVGIRGDSPSSVVRAFSMLKYDELLEGHMVYLSNQHTDAHIQRELDWKVYSSGWVDGTVEEVEVGEGGHVYITFDQSGGRHMLAAYEAHGGPQALREAAEEGGHDSRLRRCKESYISPPEDSQHGEARGKAHPRWGAGGRNLHSIPKGKQAPDQASDQIRPGGLRGGGACRGLARALYTAASARLKSSMRSSTSSIPTETLTSVSGIPVFFLSSADIWVWVML